MCMKTGRVNIYKTINEMFATTYYKCYLIIFSDNDGEGSDPEDVMGSVLENHVRLGPNGISDSNQQGPVDPESDTEDMLVETDSDSDQSNQDGGGQRSVQTGATAGSDTDDESGESTQQEDGEESEAGETDELDAEEFLVSEDQLERRAYVLIYRIMI